MKRGFTLIEILVVVGIIGAVMIVVTGILVNSFRAKTRVNLADIMEQSGGLVLSELKNNIVTASGMGMTCSGSSLVFTSTEDGGVTTLKCYEGTKIASESSNGNFDLTPAKVVVSNCSNFVTCTPFPDAVDRTIKVDFLFDLSTGDALAPGQEKFVSRTFRSSVVLRN